MDYDDFEIEGGGLHPHSGISHPLICADCCIADLKSDIVQLMQERDEARKSAEWTRLTGKPPGGSYSFPWEQE